MRRAAFFAGRVYTTRHLNAVRSPLLTGYINATGLSMTQMTFATSPLRGQAATEELASSIVAASELMLETGGSSALLGGGFGTIRSPFAVTCVGRAMSTGVVSALCGKVIVTLPQLQQ